MTARKKKKAAKKTARRAKAPKRKAPKKPAARAKARKAKAKKPKAVVVKRKITRVVLAETLIALLAPDGAPSAPATDILDRDAFRGESEYLPRYLPGRAPAGAPLGIRMAGGSDTERRGKPKKIG